MSQHARAVREAIRHIANPLGYDRVSVAICIVESVNEDERTCDCKPINDITETIIPSVNLSAEPNDGQILIPEVGSAVIVCRTDKTEPFILLTSDLSKYILFAEQILLNGDEHGGIPIAAQIASQVNAGLQAIITACIAAYTAQAGIDASVGLNAFNASITAFQPVNSVTLQNQKVKHGNK